MQKKQKKDKTYKKLIELDIKRPFWGKMFTIAPLIVVGTKEGDHYNLATKHMATPLGGDNYFGFVCTPKHKTYHNIKKEEEFSISFPKPDQVIMANLAAMPRCDDVQHKKNLIEHIPTFKTEKIDALFIKDAYLFFECKLHKIIDGFGNFSLITGKIVRAKVHKDSFRASEKDEQQMVFESPLLAYLAPGRFSKVKESFAFPFPKDYEHLVK